MIRVQKLLPLCLFIGILWADFTDIDEEWAVCGNFVEFCKCILDFWFCSYLRSGGFHVVNLGKLFTIVLVLAIDSREVLWVIWIALHRLLRRSWGYGIFFFFSDDCILKVRSIQNCSISAFILPIGFECIWCLSGWVFHVSDAILFLIIVIAWLFVTLHMAILVG